MLHQCVYQLFDMVLFGVVVFFGNFFCIVKFGVKTNVPTFKFVAGVNLKLIWLFIFCLFNIVFFISV